MDISSLNSAFADVYGTTQSESASKLEETLDSDLAVKTDDELMDACKEFEAYFVEQMFKEMMKTVPTTEGASSYSSNLMEYYQDELIQNMAEETAQGNSLGLAQMLYEQMKRNL